MNVSILIATYGEDSWDELARERALPSAQAQGVPVLIYHDPDGTIASVRNGLAQRATSDWLCFLDADDELDECYLDAMEAALHREREYTRDELLLTPSVAKVRKMSRRSPPSFYPEVPLQQANWLVIGTLITRDLFLRIGGFNDEPHGFEDWTAWAKAEKAGAKVVKVPKAVYVQHINLRSKHRLGWKNRRWQVETHQRVEAELAAWTP